MLDRPNAWTGLMLVSLNAGLAICWTGHMLDRPNILQAKCLTGILFSRPYAEQAYYWSILIRDRSNAGEPNAGQS